MPAKKAVKPAATSTSMVKWDEEFAKYAEEAVATTGVAGGNTIGLQGGIIKVGGVPVPDNKLICIATGHVFENAFYEGKFNPDSLESPVCYAYGLKQDEMRPHEASPKPQAKTCAECPQNEYGTADNYKGKACGNKRKVGIIAADALQVGIADSPVYFLKTPVTSAKNWDAHVKSIADTLRRPPFAVITEITTVPDPKTQFQVLFRVKEQIEDSDCFEALIAKHKRTMKDIVAPYPVFEKKETAPAGRNKFAAKAPAKAAKATGFGRR